MKRIIQICIISIVVLFTSCKKEKNNDLIPESESPTVTTPTVIADKQNVNQLEIVTLTSSNISFNKTTYSGTFASQTVTLTILDNLLGFQIPNVPAGTYTLQTSIEGNSYNFIYNVQALPVITNPDTYLQNAIDGILPTTVQASNLSSAMSNMYGASNNNSNNTIINNYYTNFQNAFNNATAQEKMDLAKFLMANPILTSPAEDLITQIDSLNGFKISSGYTIEDVIKNMNTEMAIRMTKILAIGVVATYCHLTPTILTQVLGLAVDLVVMQKIKELNEYLIIQCDKNVLQEGNAIVNDFQKIATPINEFNNGQEYSFDISSQYRNLKQQDVNSNSSIIKGIVTSLNKFETVWNKIMSFVPTSFVGNSFHIKHVAASHQKIFKVNAKYLNVVNISNSNVTVTTNTTTGVFKVKFNTTQPSNQVFNFDIKYTNPNVNTNLSATTGTVIAALSPNTAGFGSPYATLVNFSSAISGDQTGWIVHAASNNGDVACYIRTEGAFLPSPGTYTIVFPNGPLNSGQALVTLTTNNGAVGGFALGGILKVSIINNKTVYTFNNISFQNSNSSGSGNITLP